MYVKVYKITAFSCAIHKYITSPYRLLDEAHKQVSTSEVQDIEWDEAVPGLLQSHLHNIPVEIVQKNERFGPQYHKKSLSPELVSDTNQASASMETEGTDVKKTLPGMFTKKCYCRVVLKIN